ncbi:MAG TPA: hypothetical protein VGQ72_10805 [Pyrinomonadaceae bacterium]|jgi:hypothetical protein|nr:hypothetical protein [Pyrinomonadaceae bacterium]
MKRKVRNSIAIALGAPMAVMMFVLTAPAQQPKRKPIGDTGIVTLRPNEILRVVGDWNGDGVADIQFRQAVYVQGGVNNGVYKLMLTSQSTSQTVTLMPGEAASIDIPSNDFGVRAIVFSDKPNLHVNAMIVDATTGNIIAMLVGG